MGENTESAGPFFRLQELLDLKNIYKLWHKNQLPSIF